jgi:hypothetical protein
MGWVTRSGNPAHCLFYLETVVHRVLFSLSLLEEETVTAS